MKIVVIGARASSLLSFRGQLLRDLVDLGHKVVAVSPDPNLEVQEALKEQDIQSVVIPFNRTGMNPVADLRYFRMLRSFFNREKPDMVFAYTSKPVIFGLLAARIAKVPRRVGMMTGLGYAFATGSTKQRLLRSVMAFLYKIAFRGSYAAIFQNPDDEQLFVDSGLVSSEITRIVNGSGVNTSHFAFEALPDYPPIFLLTARMLKSKGVPEFVSAARLIKSEHPEVTFNLLGRFDTGGDAILPAQIQAWEEEGIVRYLGFASDVRPHLKASHAFVLPSSYREGTPRSILEAMSMGRAIITTDTPGCRETVIDGYNGFLVGQNNPQELAHAMRKLLNSPQLFDQMGRASRQYALDKYEVSLVNQQMLQALGIMPVDSK